MTSVDVLIVTALPEEYAVARTVGLTLAASDNAEWQQHERDGSDPYETIKIRNSSGASLSVALARPTRMGGRSIGPTATALAGRLNPQCLAMCGVCAGNPSVVGLGDVVVAELAYEYDEGKRTPTEFSGDHRQFVLDDRWLRTAQEFAPSSLPSFGQAGREEAKLWFLERLRAGDEPRAHPARARYFPQQTWETWTAEMQADGLILWSGQGWELTDEGKSRIERKWYNDVDGPDRLPFAVSVGPMASGSGVAKDGAAWEQLAQMGVRSVAALEMEAATLATAARHQHIPHWLVVKGVMDHADPRKDDRYKTFAARASAEVLFALLTQLLQPVVKQPAGPTRAPSTESAPAGLTDGHRQTLQLISEMFQQNDSWPAFNLIDRPLRKHGIDAAHTVMSMPAGFMVGRRGNARPMRDDPMQLTLRGLALCDGTGHDIELFLTVTRWAAELDDSFDPGTDPHAAPRLTSQEVAQTFGLVRGRRRDLRRLYAMMQVQRWGFGSGGGGPDNWWWEIDREIQRFATVTTAEAYDQARTVWLIESASAVSGTENPTSHPVEPLVRRVSVHELLDQLAARDPVPDLSARVNGHLYLVVSPRATVDDAIGAVCTPSAAAELDTAVQRAIAVRIKPNPFSPDFSSGRWRRDSSGIRSTAGVSENGSVQEKSLLVLTVREDATVTVLCGRATDQARPVWHPVGKPRSRSTRPVIFPGLVLGLVHSALFLAADLAQRYARYDGQWDIGLRLTGISNAIAYDYVRSGDEDVVNPYDEDTYERTTIALTADMATDAAEVAERLVAPLLRALTVDLNYLPYNAV